MQSRPIFIISFFFLLLPFFSNAILAQSRTVTIIGGIVEKQSREPLVNALVQLRSTKNAQRFYGRSSKNGVFSVALPAGEYDIFITMLGYKSFAERYIIQDRMRLDISLEQEDIRLQRVSVEAEQISPALVSVVSLSADEIKRLPSLGAEADVLRAIQLLPGVKAANEVSSGLYVRGGSPDQTLILFDGVTIYNPAHLFGIFSSFNPDAVSDLRLYKGAFPAEYGGRLSSVLDITMKEGSKERLGGSASVSLISAHTFVEGPIGEKASFMLSGRSMYLGGLAQLLKLDNSIPIYNFYDLNAKTTLAVSDNDRVSLSGYFGRDDLLAGKNNGGFSFGWDNSLAQLRWTHLFSPVFFTTVAASYSAYRYDYKDEPATNFLAAQAVQSSSFIRDIAVRAEANYLGLPGHSVKLGVEGVARDISSSVQTATGLEPDKNILQNVQTAGIEATAFVQDEWQITSTITANIGLRSAYFSNGSYVRFEPRASLVWRISDNTTLKAAAAVTNQFTHRIENGFVGNPSEAWFIANQNILPSQSVQYVFGAETMLLNQEYALSVEAYYKTMDNLYEFRDTIQQRRGIPPESQLTLGAGTAYGVEILLQKRVGIFTGWVGYTLSQTSRLFPELNNGQPFDAHFDRRSEVQATASYKLNDTWEVGATFVFASGQPFTLPVGVTALQPYTPAISVSAPPVPVSDPLSRLIANASYYPQRGNIRLPTYHRLDVSATHKFQWLNLPFELNISVINLYNQKNALSWRLRQTSYDGRNITYQLEQIFALPILPTAGLRFTF